MEELRKVMWEWKLPSLYSVDAQTAGEELERIKNKYGYIAAANVVEESRSPNSKLHDCFEWDDTAAAEKYRETQARTLIRNITCRVEEVHMEPVRAFFHTKTFEYQPMKVVFQTPDMREELILSAIREMTAFRRKYQILSELEDVFKEFEKATAKLQQKSMKAETDKSEERRTAV